MQRHYKLIAFMTASMSWIGLLSHCTPIAPSQAKGRLFTTSITNPAFGPFLTVGPGSGFTLLPELLAAQDVPDEIKSSPSLSEESLAPSATDFSAGLSSNQLQDLQINGATVLTGDQKNLPRVALVSLLIDVSSEELKSWNLGSEVLIAKRNGNSDGDIELSFSGKLDPSVKASIQARLQRVVLKTAK